MAPPDEAAPPDGVNPPATQLLDRLIEAALDRRTVADHAPRSGGPGGTGGSEPLEARVAKVEATLENIDKALVEMKQDIRSLRDNARVDFRLVFAAIIAVALGLAGVMAKGFHWL